MAAGLNIHLRYFIVMLSFMTLNGLNAQILHDTAAIRLIKKGTASTYNFQFEKAHEICAEIDRQYPGHPAVILMNSAVKYWENFPLMPSSAARSSFEKGLRETIDACEKRQGQENDAEYLLINLCARGLLLLYMTDNGVTLETVPLALSTYQYIRHSFDYISSFYDFNYFKGVFDYYREAYPEKYPIYKPLASLFPKGDREKGLMELKLAADSSIFLKAEALMVLEDLFLRFENNSQQAILCTRTLYENYPQNPEFMEEYIKSLLYVKQYDNAENLIRPAVEKQFKPFFKAQLDILEGILQEKKYHDNARAKDLYKKGIEAINQFGNYASEYSSYAYYGLSRISESEGDKHFKKVYRREANKLSEFKKMNFDE